MTSAHIFFIPGMIIIGMFFGFIFGARAARNQMDMERKREDERVAAREARAARRAGAGKVDDRPPAEAKSAEVESERKSDDPIAEEKPAPEDKKPEPAKKAKGKRS